MTQSVKEQDLYLTGTPFLANESYSYKFMQKWIMELLLYVLVNETISSGLEER